MLKVSSINDLPEAIVAHQLQTQRAHDDLEIFWMFSSRYKRIVEIFFDSI